MNGKRTFKLTFTAAAGGTPKEDLYLLSDATGSMGSAIRSAQTKFRDVVAKRRAASGDVAFGVGFYRDEGTSGLDSGFRNLQSITTDETAVQSAISELRPSGGGDRDEANLVALYKVATLGSIGWREGARRILVYFGDNPGHEPTCVGGLELTRANVITALKAKEITVVAASFGSRGLDATPTRFGCTSGSAGSGQASAITSSSGGALVSSSDQSKLVEQIESTVGGLSLTYMADTSECNGKVSVSYSPVFPFSLGPGASRVVTQTVTIEPGICETGGSFTCKIKYTASGGDLPTTTVKVTRVSGC